MDEIEIQIEGAESTAKTVQDTFREWFGLRAAVKTVTAGTLPRYELKARRFTDHREQS